MKTPEEIKKGLERCKEGAHCNACANSYHCQIEEDALAYIKQLEDGIDRIYKLAKDINVPTNQPEWISVFDVVPEKFKDVLACDENGNLGIVQFFDDNKPYEMREDGWTEVEVYYWMYIPELPKEDD